MLKEDVRDTVTDEAEPNLLDSLTFTVMEEALQGATWETAREHFEEWVKIELADILPPAGPLPHDQCFTNNEAWMRIQNFHEKLEENPRYTHFLYVDDASVDSVVRPLNPDGTTTYGDYYATVVQSRLIDFGLEEDDDSNTTLEPFPEDFDNWLQEDAEEIWQKHRQKVGVDQVAQMYALIYRGDWPDMGWELNAAGVAEIVCI